MHRPPEELKPLASSLAQAALAENGSDVVRLLDLAALWGQEPGGQEQAPASASASGAGAAAPADVQRVGIWQRKSHAEPGVFVRAADRMDEWHDWANVGRIEPKHTKYRVALVGESAARGWLYDPEYTPAQVLQAVLASRLGEQAVEVIDLARTNLSMEIEAVARSAVALEPDIIVMFAGNNWYAPQPRDVSELAHWGGKLCMEGVAGLKAVAEDRLRKAVSGLIARVNDFCSAHDVRVVWMIPESNLVDWHDGISNAAYLPGDLGREWLERALQAQRMMDRRSWIEAVRAAQRMTEIDQGTCSYSLSLLGRCELALGRGERARTQLEAAREAPIWDGSQLTSPRPYLVTQRALAEQPPSPHVRVVDLRKVFAAKQKGSLPSAELFLDYCHLNAAGIRLAMAAAAAQITEVLSQQKVDVDAMLKLAPQPPNEVRAEASLLAAIHNAHWWQPEAIVRHHCVEAVRASPHVADVMVAFAQMQNSSAPMMMTPHAQRMTAAMSKTVQQYILRMNEQRLDVSLLRSFDHALREIKRDADADDLRSLSLAAHSATRRPRELLEFFYSSSACLPKELLWSMPGGKVQGSLPHYHRAYWIESAFAFVADAGTALIFRMTCRLPRHSDADGVEISVNGVSIARIDVGQKWATYEVRCPGDVISDGINELRIRWPATGSAHAGGAAAALQALGSAHALFTVFGEIHALTAARRYS